MKNYPALATAIFEQNIDLLKEAINNGDNPNDQFTNWSFLELAIYQGLPRFVEEMINHGGELSSKSYLPLFEQDITDWMIQTEDDDKRYSEVIMILTSHNIYPENVKDLIDLFPHSYYPNINKKLKEIIHRTNKCT